MIDNASWDLFIFIKSLRFAISPYVSGFWIKQPKVSLSGLSNIIFIPRGLALVFKTDSVCGWHLFWTQKVNFVLFLILIMHPNYNPLYVLSFYPL